jgi:hypothetical protein
MTFPDADCSPRNLCLPLPSSSSAAAAAAANQFSYQYIRVHSGTSTDSTRDSFKEFTRSSTFGGFLHCESHRFLISYVIPISRCINTPKHEIFYFIHIYRFIPPN